MSKIALTPNASGTGTFTLAAPNSNTSRTITLPDEAGEVLVNTAAGINVTGTVTADGLTSSAVITAQEGRSNTAGTGQIVIDPDDTTVSAAFRLDQADNKLNIDMTNAGTWQKKLSVYTGGDISFYEDTGTTPKFFWDASAESLGIGTSSPAYRLQVKDASTSSTSNYIGVVSGNAGNAGVIFGDSDADAVGGVLFNNSDNALRFFKSGFTEAMRIDSSGNVLVGTTNTDPIGSSSDGMRIGSGFFNINKGSSVSGYFGRSGTDGGILGFYKNGTTVGSISVTASATAYNTSSDYRLKTDAQPMTGASARVQALNPVNFEWIADGTRVDGFLAHEAQEVVPEAVTGTKDAMRDEEYEVTPAVYEDLVIPAVLDEDGNELEAERTEQQLVTEAVMGTRSVPDYQGIDQSKLVPLLTAALQEALTEISDLKARVTALEAV